jgi:O-antigen ligase
MDNTPVNHQTPSEKIEWLDRFIFYGLFMFAVFSCIFRIGALAALFVTAVLIIIRHCQLPYQKWIPRGLIAAYILFTCSLLPSFAFSPDLQSSIRPFSNMIFDIVPFLLIWFGITKKKQIIPLIAALAFSLAVSGVSIIYQGFTSGLDQALRFISFGYICMVTSGFIGILLPLLGVVILEQRELNPWLKAGLIATAFIGVVALLINMNRGVWISMVAITLVYLLVKLRKISRWALTALILFAVVALTTTIVPQLRVRAEFIRHDIVSLADNYKLIFQENPTAEFEKIIKNTGKTIPERIYMWNGAWRMFREHPWNGVGLGSVGDVFQSGFGYISPLAFYPPAFVHAHNNFLQFLAAAGIFGFLGFTGLFAFVLCVSIRRYNRNPADWWSLIGFLVTVGFLIQGLTEYNYIHSVLVRLYWFVFGMSMIASHLNLNNAGEIKRRMEGDFA